MNKVIVSILTALVISGCCDWQDLKHQYAIKSLQNEVDELKRHPSVHGGSDIQNTNPSSTYIAPPIYKSQLDAELASATIDRGIDRVTLNSIEGGGTNVTIITNGKPFSNFHSHRDFSDSLKIFGGQYSEKIIFLLAEESAMYDGSVAIKQAILAVLQDR